MSVSAERVTSIRKSMSPLEVLESLFGRSSATFVYVLEPLPEGLEGLAPFGLLEETTIRRRILDNELSLAVHSEHQGSTRTLDPLGDLGGVLCEVDQGIGIRNGFMEFSVTRSNNMDRDSRSRKRARTAGRQGEGRGSPWMSNAPGKAQSAVSPGTVRFFGRRPASRSARRRMKSSWPLALRSSSPAQARRASSTRGSVRNRKDSRAVRFFAMFRVRTSGLRVRWPRCKATRC